MKKVTIEVTNEELDALEDLLVCKLTDDQVQAYRVLCLNLWGKLVREYDKMDSPFTIDDTFNHFKNV